MATCGYETCLELERLALEIVEVSKEMVEHFLDNVAAKERAKAILNK